MAELVYNGNIDLLNRPVVKNEDGSISTLSSINFEQDGKHILIPTINENGERMSDEDAIKEYEKTGKHLGVFETSEEAENAGQAISNYMGKTYEKGFNIFDYEDRAKEIQARRNTIDYSTPLISNIKVDTKDWRNYLNPQVLEGFKRAQELYYKAYTEQMLNEETARERAAIDAENEINAELYNISLEKLKKGEWSYDNVYNLYSKTSTFKNKKDWSLEYMAANKDVNSSKDDNEIAGVNLSGLEELSVKITKANSNLTMTMADTAAERFLNLYPNHGKRHTIKEFIQYAIPFYDLYQDNKMSGRNDYTWGAEAKERLKNLIQKAEQEMSPPQFNNFIKTLDDYMLVESKGNEMNYLGTWADISGVDISSVRNLYTLVDAKVVGGYFTKFRKIAQSRKIAAEDKRLIKEIGDRTGTAEDILQNKEVVEDVSTEAAKTSKNISKQSQDAGEFVTENTTPTALKSTGNESISTEVSNNLSSSALNKQTYQRWTNDVLKIGKEDLISEEEIERDLELYRGTLKKKFNFSEEEVKNIEHLQVSKDGEVYFEIAQSTKTNKPFISMDAAKEYASKHLITGEYTVVESDNGFKIVSKTALPHIEKSVDDLAKGLNDFYLLKDKPWKSSWLGRHIFARKNIPDKYHALDIVQGRAQITYKERAGSLYNFVRKLNKKEEERLGEVVKASDLEGKWFSRQVLEDSYGLSKKEQDAYYAIRALNDLEYLAKNKTVYDSLFSQGYREFTGKNLNVIAKHVDDFDPSKTPFKDLTTGRYYKVGDLDRKGLNKLLGDDKIILQKYTTTEDNLEEIYRYVVVNRGDVVSNDLPEFMIKYVPGPRRFYKTGTMFAKAPKTFTQAGVEYLLRPKTLWASLDEVSVKQKAEELNGALRIYREFRNGAIDEKTLTSRLNKETAGNKYIRVADKEDLVENYIEKYKLDYRHDIEVVKDGEELKQIKALRSRGLSFMNNDEDYVVNSLQDLLDNNERFYRSRGEHLRTPAGEYTATVSPKRLAYNLVNKYVATETMPLYNKLYAKGLRENFWDVIEPTANYKNMSDSEFLRTVQFVNSKDPKVLEKVSAAKNLVQHWKNTQMVPTEFDNTIRSWMQAVADFLGDSLPSLFGKGTDRYESLANARPDQWLHSAAFHTYLGIWNIRQLALQAMGATNIGFIEPALSAKNAPLYSLYRIGLSTDNSKIIEKLGKSAASLIPGAEKDFAFKLKILKKIGTGGAGLSRIGYASGDIGFRGWIKHSSEVFFREGERVPAIMSDLVAIDKVAEKYGVSMKGLYNDSKLLKEVVGLADDYYANMTRMSTASYQRGLSGLITQFWAYPFRITEQLLSKHFTPAQKVRIIVGNIATFGLDGFLGLSTYDWLKGTFDLTPEMAQMLAEGSLNAISRATGADVDFTEMGPEIVGRVNDTVVENNVIGLFSRMPVTNLFLQVSDVLKIFKMVSDYWQPEGSDADGMRAIKYIAVESHLPSSIRNTTKAALALYTKKVYTNNYKLLKDDATLKDVVIAGLGLRPIEKKDIENYYNTVAYKKETIEDIKKDLLKHMNIIKDNPNDMRAAKDYSNLSMAAKQAVLDLYGSDDYMELNTWEANQISQARLSLPKEIEMKILKQLNPQFAEEAYKRGLIGRQNNAKL